MAELVDALVSNTSGSNTVPVRPRLWVLFIILKIKILHIPFKGFSFILSLQLFTKLSIQHITFSSLMTPFKMLFS